MTRDLAVARDLVVDCARLTAGVIDRIEVRCRSVIGAASVQGVSVLDDAVELDVVLQAAGSSLVASGRLAGAWTAECRRCLEEVRGPLETSLREVFEWDPVEGETWPIEQQRVDLAPLVREAAMLSLPLAPLCSQDCAGPVPHRFPTGPVDMSGA